MNKAKKIKMKGDNAVFLVSSILLMTVLFSACKKENPVKYAITPVPYFHGQAPSASPQDSLTGREFLFNDLVWNYDVDGAANLYLGIENRPDLFGSSNRSVAVSLKLSSLNNWLVADKFQYPNTSEFVYSIYSNSLFIFHNPHIFPWSPDTHLAGQVFSVKIRFL